MLTQNLNSRTATLLLLITMLIARLLIGTQFLLVPDETNYWQWSRYLALGYHDHPPMIAWSIWLATKIFGHSEFAVRLPTILGVSVASLYMSLLASRLYSWRCAFHTALISMVVLLFNGSALIATPDGLLLPCWAGCCYHAALALEQKRTTPCQWVLTGIWFGLGMLSKYTMLLFLPSLFFCMLFTPKYRIHLLSIWPWLGLLISGLLFTPVIIWNAANEWATFRHVLYQGGVDNSAFFSLRYVGDFLGAQAILISPLLFLLILTCWFYPPARQRRLHTYSSFLTWMSLTGFLAFFFLSFHVRIYGNWPSPTYLTAIILVTALFSPLKDQVEKTSSLWKSTLITAAVISAVVIIQVVYPLLPLSVKLDRTARETIGWDTLGQRMHQEIKQMKRPDQTFIFGLRYQFASELAFYTPGHPKTLSINRWTRPNVYDFWFTDAMVTGMDGVGIVEHKSSTRFIGELFERFDPIEEITLWRNSPWLGRQKVHTLYLFRGYGFKGGLRWQPQDANDIRATNKQTSSN